MKIAASHQTTTLSVPKLADELGVTNRQLDYWLRNGWFGPDLARAVGSGVYRDMAAADLDAIRQIVAEWKAAHEVLDRIATGARWAELTAARA